jgi:hypothetical protein
MSPLTTHTVLCELAAFAAYFVYGSYFEWFFHRYLFHSPKYVYRTFREHTLVHHQIYKGDHTYLAQHDHDHPEKVTMDWWAMPLMILFHLPLFYLVQRVTGVPSLWGGVAAFVVYFSLYESFHWAMHVPKASKFMSRFQLWRFLDDHHHVHHKYMLSNLNVIFPLADLTLGTLRDRTGKRIQPLYRRKADLPVPVKATTPAAQTTTATPVKPTSVKPKATAGTLN